MLWVVESLQCKCKIVWVVHGMRGVGGVCEMCMCLVPDGVGGEGVSG